MRRIFYYYNSHGALIFEYRDNSGRYIDRCYLYYSFREALRRFRNEFHLQRKHIELINLYEKEQSDGKLTGTQKISLS